jgi:hypothetical protein
MMKPLTVEEQEFAAKNHDLIFAFLKKKKLPVHAFYDVVVFGYLKAVKIYFSQNQQPRYRFSTLAWKWMESELSKYYKYLVCPKRRATVISLEEQIGKRNILSHEGLIGISDKAMQMLEVELLLHDLSAKLSPRAMRIIRMKMSGERMNEIAKKEHMTFHAINQLLNGVYPIVISVLFPL